MNKISFFFLALLLAGCSKDYNTVVDVPVQNFQVSAVGTINSYTYNPTAPDIVIKVKLSATEGVNSVYCDVYKPDNKLLNTNHLELLDNGNLSANGDSVSGDNIYSNKLGMQDTYANGNYNVKYYASMKDGSDVLVAQQVIAFDNGQNNIAPVISSLVMPDTVQTGNKFTFTVQASDSNGLTDISQVYYELFDPSGSKIVNSKGISKFPLSDSGDSSNSGDLVANDGIFTNNLTFPNNPQYTGDWVFKFHAVDSGGKISNEISKTVTVK